MAWSHRKDARNKNIQGNTLLETHFKKTSGKTKDTLWDVVRKDIQKLKVPNWKTLVQDRRRWKEFVEKAKTLHKEL
jgi:RNAse (barnase) inhibitor barstar